jgi:hypothetical protein
MLDGNLKSVEVPLVNLSPTTCWIALNFGKAHTHSWIERTNRISLQPLQHFACKHSNRKKKNKTNKSNFQRKPLLI